MKTVVLFLAGIYICAVEYMLGTNVSVVCVCSYINYFGLSGTFGKFADGEKPVNMSIYCMAV